MIDMAQMVRQCFSAQEIDDYVSYDVGGSSEEFLRTILAPASAIDWSNPEDHEG